MRICIERLAYACQRSTLEEALQRLEKALHNIEKSMGDELQKYINMREFEKLKDKEIREAEKEKNKEKDKEIDQEHE